MLNNSDKGAKWVLYCCCCTIKFDETCNIHNFLKQCDYVITDGQLFNELK